MRVKFTNLKGLNCAKEKIIEIPKELEFLFNENSISYDFEVLKGYRIWTDDGYETYCETKEQAIYKFNQRTILYNIKHQEEFMTVQQMLEEKWINDFDDLSNGGTIGIYMEII